MTLTRAMTQSGEVSGILAGYTGYTVYKGIPYAAPPVGHLRWAAPKEPEPWTGIKLCDQFPPISVQTKSKVGEFYQKEFFPVQAPMSEDCLYLNIWTPAQDSGEHLPVMVWIHGGAFMHGYGHEIEFDGEAFCKRGVILVTLNYRLGALGYMAHPALSEQNMHGISGNYGLLDQVQALKWVNKNIAAFGGDPSNVTVFGQSAGGGSVIALCASPLTKGLIHKAIIQSAGGVGTLGGRYTLAEAEAFGSFIVQNANMSWEDFYQLPAEEILQKSMEAGMIYGNEFKLRLLPCTDGYVLPDDPGQVIADGKHLPIPYMSGCVTGDSKLFGEQKIDWLQLKSENYPLYVYRFERDMPGCDNAGAFHSSELWYIFGTIPRCWRPLTGEDYDLSLQMTYYWTNFAKSKTGNPNQDGLALWHPHTDENRYVHIFDV